MSRPRIYILFIVTVCIVIALLLILKNPSGQESSEIRDIAVAKPASIPPRFPFKPKKSEKAVRTREKKQKVTLESKESYIEKTGKKTTFKSVSDLGNYCYEKYKDGKTNLSFSKSDLGCDGTFESCDYTLYNEKGEAVSGWDDDQCDGTIDSCRTSEIDEHGNTLQYNSDSGCDGKDILSICFSYTYDKQGRKLTNVSHFPCETKKPSCTRYEYNEQGDTIGYQDEGCDDAVEYCFREVRNEDNIRIAFIKDDKCDETIDSCNFADVDDEGNKTVRSLEGDCTELLKERGLL